MTTGHQDYHTEGITSPRKSGPFKESQANTFRRLWPWRPSNRSKGSLLHWHSAHRTKETSLCPTKGNGAMLHVKALRNSQGFVFIDI